MIDRFWVRRLARIAGIFAATAAISLTLPIFNTETASAASYKLRYSELGPPRGARAETLKWWAEEVSKRSDGQIEVEFFWSQSLTKGKDTFKAVGAGLVDMGTILGVYTPAELPLWNLANVPFSGRDPWVATKSWQEIRKQSPELRAETEKKNVMILANYTTGPVDILSKEPVLSLEDLKGLKIRSTGGWSALLQKLGATPVSIGFGEIYQALDKGVVDAATNYIHSVNAYKHYEVAGHMTEVQMGQLLGFGMGINKSTFDRMPADIQKIILETSDAFIEEWAKRYASDIASARKALKAGIDGKSVEFHVLSEEERARWSEAAEFFVEDWVESVGKSGFDGRAFVSTLDGLKAKYTEEAETQGYPWER